MNQKDLKQLVLWYKKSGRKFPWRESKNPYHIWICEVMSQQTTLQAVLPYYERFIKKFPTIKKLAIAETSEVLEMWAGLGYYSRAKNLHRSAKELHSLKYFPKSYLELIKLPGFGPYTSRAVSSIAFDENVGVLDGNVIRVITRYDKIFEPWWNSKIKNQLQLKMDEIVKGFSSSDVNQALMDLGSTICTPTKPLCSFCPIQNGCLAKKLPDPTVLPLKKPKKDKEVWVWNPHLYIKNGQVALILNHGNLPFLKDQWILPGKATLKIKVPDQFGFIHHITHHNIYVSPRLTTRKLNESQFKQVKWIEPKNIYKTSPSSLIKKSLKNADLF